MFDSIPASNIAAVYPAVIGGGGNPLGLNTTLFVSDAVYPNFEYTTPNLVGQHYGLTSEIYKGAVVYFKGFDGATTRPNSLFISAYNKQDIAAYLVGGDVSGLTTAQIKAITGTLSVVIDGVEKSGNIDLSTANSLSDAAQVIATALTINCTYAANLKGFVIKSGTTGEGSTLSFANGATAEALKLTQATGAILNNDVLADSAETAAKRALKFSKNFVNFTFSPDTMNEAAYRAFSSWVTLQDSRYKFYVWSMDPLWLGQSGLDFPVWAAENTEGIVPLYGAFDKAMFFCGVSASVNYEETNGRTTTMFRSQAGLVAEVTDEDEANLLKSKGCSFYGAWATANDRFQMAGIGAVTGKFKWIDNQDFWIFLASQIQLADINMLRSQGTVPYNQIGEAIQRAYLQDPINQGVNFGGIQAGVQLSEAQKFQINQEAGFDAASQLFTKGWAISIQQPSTQVRIERGTPIRKIFYTDGSSVQRLETTVTNVQ